MRQLFILLLFVFACVSVASAHSYQAGKVSIGHPWAAPSEDGTAQVYMGIMNMGDKADQLVGASTSIARKIALHELRADKQGTGTVNAFDLPVNRGVSLRPGGSHISLEGLRGPLVAGDKFTLRLQFADTPATDVTVFVEDHGSQHK